MTTKCGELKGLYHNIRENKRLFFETIAKVEHTIDTILTTTEENVEYPYTVRVLKRNAEELDTVNVNITNSIQKINILLNNIKLDKSAGIKYWQGESSK